MSSMSDVPARMLRETLRGRTPTDAASGCVDTDTLAAWSDCTLSARERAAAESHASGCARRQALLAAMARTAPPAPPRKWWRTSTVRWLLPLPPRAAAIVAWDSVPRAPLQQHDVPPPAPAQTHA